MQIKNEYFPESEAIDINFDTTTITFPPQHVFASVALTSWSVLQGDVGNTSIVANIESYTKADGTVVQLGEGPSRIFLTDTGVVSVTFMLTVSSPAQVQASAGCQVMLLG